MIYAQGSIVRLTGTFKNAQGQLEDPEEVHVVVIDPDDVKTLYAYDDVPPLIVRSSQGVYYLDLEITKTGPWTYGWYSIGAGQTADILKRLDAVSGGPTEVP